MHWGANKYLVLSINWESEKGHVDISMPDYILKSLDRFQHPKQNAHNMHHISGHFLPMDDNYKCPQNNNQHPC